MIKKAIPVFNQIPTVMEKVVNHLITFNKLRYNHLRFEY